MQQRSGVQELGPSDVMVVQLMVPQTAVLTSTQQPLAQAEVHVHIVRARLFDSPEPPTVRQAYNAALHVRNSAGMVPLQAPCEAAIEQLQYAEPEHTTDVPHANPATADFAATPVGAMSEDMAARALEMGVASGANKMPALCAALQQAHCTVAITSLCCMATLSCMKYDLVSL